MFPILFATITGRAAIKLATWKLEKGSTLGLLEQLMGSRTVASTIITQFQLRSFNLIGIGLIALWSLSPIGSQSVLHILSDPLVPISSSTTVTYFNLRQQSFGAPGGEFELMWFNGFSLLFGASLLAPPAVKDGNMDLWGNPKIPVLSSVMSSGAIPDADGWVQIPRGNFTPTYSSLFGLPMKGMALGNTTVNVETSYIELGCGNLTTAPQTNSTGGFEKTSLISTSGPFFSAREVFLDDDWAIGYKGPDVTAYVANSTATFIAPQNCPDCLSGNTTILSVAPGELLYQEYLSFSNSVSIFCTPSQIYVESSILCQKSANDQLCQVTAQRPSQLPHPTSSITYLSFPEIALGLTNTLYNSTPTYDLSNPIQGFLYDAPSNLAILLESASLGLDPSNGPLESQLYNVSMEDFAHRFAQLVNAWVHGSFYNNTAITTGAPFSFIHQTAVSGNAASFIATPDAALPPLIENRTAAFTVPAVLTNTMHIYKCDFVWTAAFMLATLAMLVAAVVGVVISRVTVVPDYLGYVSSLAKESPYVKMPVGGVNLDGMERARFMKNLRVRLGDLDEGRGSVGRLAFAGLEDTEIVRKDSFYV
jgi:hypothetical protein